MQDVQQICKMPWLNHLIKGKSAKCPPHLLNFFFYFLWFFFLISLLPTLNHSLRDKLLFRSAEIYDSSHLRHDLLRFFKLGHSGMNVQKKEPRLKKMNSRLRAEEFAKQKFSQNAMFHLFVGGFVKRWTFIFFCFYYY